MEEFLKQINEDVKDIFGHNIITTNAFVVPTRNDPNLTFTIGDVKKGKILETCILMIDIRDSTKISRKLRKDKVKLGKIYSSFIHAMATIADEYGYVRNIIGDRLMVVFEPENCFVNALNCGIVMYSVARKILDKYFDLDDFKVGLGIEFGEMLVLKTGIRKKHEEQSEYKNLVWIGDAANTASKLCDFANKKFSSQKFHVTYEYIDIERTWIGFEDAPATSHLDKVLNGPKKIPKYRSDIVTKKSTISLNCQEFAEKVKVEATGWKYEGKKVVSLNVENKTGSTEPILMSGKVFEEYEKAQRKSPYLNSFSEKDYPDSPYTGTGIYGGRIILPEIQKIKL